MTLEGISEMKGAMAGIQKEHRDNGQVEWTPIPGNNGAEEKRFTLNGLLSSKMERMQKWRDTASMADLAE